MSDTLSSSPSKYLQTISFLSTGINQRHKKALCKLLMQCNSAAVEQEEQKHYVQYPLIQSWTCATDTGNRKNAFWPFYDKYIQKETRYLFSILILMNTMAHHNWNVEEIMQFLFPNQLWNLLDGYSVTVLKMLLLPHTRNHSRVPLNFLYQEKRL